MESEQPTFEKTAARALKLLSEAEDRIAELEAALVESNKNTLTPQQQGEIAARALFPLRSITSTPLPDELLREQRRSQTFNPHVLAEGVQEKLRGRPDSPMHLARDSNPLTDASERDSDAR